MAVTLALDIGNSRIKAGFFEGSTLVETLVTERPLSLALVKEWSAMRTIGSIIMSAVRVIEAEEMNGIKTTFRVVELDQHTPLPIKMGYATPETLGTDRICAAVAAHAMFPTQPVLAIDAGTCITYELVDAGGTYRGGAISPGVQMRLRAMNTFTDRLPLVQPENVEGGIGTTTETSLQMGAVAGTWFEMQGFVHHFSKQHAGLKTILTGGDSALFRQHAEIGIFAAPNLVLEGLNQILLHNNR